MKFSKQKKLIIILMFLFCVVLLFPQSVNAYWGETIVNAVISGLGEIASWIISPILEIMLSLAGFLLGLAMTVLDFAISSKLFDEVFFSSSAKAGLNAGWGLVRDLVNMFFILILVFLAIATILRVNKFSDKKILMSVIFAALLVNFSKPVTLFVIDLSNLAMGFFMNSMTSNNASYTSTFLNSLNFSEALKSKTTGSHTAFYVAMISATIFKLVMAGMMGLLAISLIVRMVALWTLIILSPLAFFGMALPGTVLSSIKDNWTKKLIYWCFYGPVLLFFLWIALVMIGAISNSIDVSTQTASIKMEAMTVKEAGLEFVVGTVGIIIPFTAAIYMLFYGYSLSKSIAAGAGSLATKAMSGKGAAVAGVLATGGLGYLGYKWGKNKFGAAKEAYDENKNALFSKARREDLKKKRKANSMFAGAGEKERYQANQVNERLREWDDTGEPNKTQLSGILNTTNSSATDKQAAALRLAKNGDITSADYKIAMNNMKNDPGLVSRLKGNARKKNRHAVIEYDIDQEIAKAGTSSPSAISAIRQNEYDKAMEGMILSEIGDQNIDFHKTKEFQTFMRVNTGAKGSGSRFDDDMLRTHASKKMDATKQAVWKSKGYFI